MVNYRIYGASFGYLQYLDLMVEQQLETIHLREKLQGILVTIFQKVSKEVSKILFLKKFKVGTLWIGRPLFFNALVKWVFLV